MEDNKALQTGSFVTEALVISVSNLLVKIIGVVFKIPIANLLEEKMEMFTAAYSLYAMLFMVSTAGLPVAISRMVASSQKRNNKKETNRIFNASLILFGIIGLVCMLFMFFGSNAIAKYSEHADAALAMKVISPTILLVCLSSAIRGYFQGHHIMIPTAGSQFIEAVFKMTVGLVAAGFAVRKGYSPAVQAACAIAGVSIGMLIALAFLIIYKYNFEKKNKFDTVGDTESYKKIYRNLIKIAIPVTITSSVLYLSNFLDTIVIKKCLIGSGIAEEAASSMYTAYTTLSTSISDILPATFVYPIAISILPTIAASVAINDIKSAHGYVHSSIRITGIIAFPCAFGLCAVAREALVLLYTADWGSEVMWNGKMYSSVDIASGGLRILAVGIIFISLLSTTNALLQALKGSHLPMISVGIGAVMLIVSEILLVSNKDIGIYGAPCASVICYITALILNMIFLYRIKKFRFNIVKLFAKPFICSLLCGGAAYGVVKLGENLLNAAYDRIGALVTLCFAGAAGAAVYVVSLVIIKGITAEEVKLLPKGKKICGFLISKGLIKDE